MLYDIGFAIFSLFYLPTLIFKGKLHGDFLERFGVYDKSKTEMLRAARGAIWIQAVSVGEVALCRSFVPQLRQKFPTRPIIFSTITKTGNDLAKKLFAKDAVIIYFPLDLSFIVKKVIKLVQPKMYIMVETEIWPNFLKAIGRSAIPSTLINGRISDRSIGKYKLAKPFLKKILENMNALCMQSKTDADRIIELGARPENVKVTGNMKFDIQVKESGVNAEEIRKSLGLSADDELLVAGSTHSGEEEAIVEAYKDIIQEFPKLKLLIAPRHVERSGEIEAIIKKLGFNPIRLSNSPTPLISLPTPLASLPTPRIYLLDTIGRLNDFYSIATIVFVGGSLIKHGGQNPIEPAIYGKPIVFGPYMFNFKEISAAFLSKGGAIRVGYKDELPAVLYNLLTDKDRRMAMGSNAKRVVLENRGATEKNMEAINRYA